MKRAFVTTLDDRYVSGFLITLNSLLKSSKNFDYDLIIFEWGELSDDNKKIISKLYQKIIYKNIKQESYIEHKFDSTFREWTYNCNYRFDIFTLKEYEKIIYFDCDIIFELSADEMMETDADFGACVMPSYSEYPQVEGSKIFNAGLMVIGQKYLNDGVKNDLIEIANQKPPNILTTEEQTKWIGNQPILNKYFLDKITWLPLTFNTLTQDVTIETFDEKVNYHFIGNKKPWAKSKSEKFEKYILNEIANITPHLILQRLIVRKLIEKCDLHIEDLLNKGIDIKTLF